MVIKASNIKSLTGKKIKGTTMASRGGKKKKDKKKNMARGGRKRR